MGKTPHTTTAPWVATTVTTLTADASRARADVMLENHSHTPHAYKKWYERYASGYAQTDYSTKIYQHWCSNMTSRITSSSTSSTGGGGGRRRNSAVLWRWY